MRFTLAGKSAEILIFIRMEIISISSINQYEYCPRRCGLMLVEGIWSDNEHTVSGTILHKQTDIPGYEVRRGVKLIRSLPIFSRKLGISGKADIVEIRGKEYIPVEYKKGKRRKYSNDDMQLATQALCLEEMFAVEISRGFIYHMTSKKRREVLIDEELRNSVISALQNIRTILETSKVPTACYSSRCEGCSLYKDCLPKLTDSNQREKLILEDILNTSE